MFCKVQSDDQLLGVMRYVERTPLSAGLVDGAELWRLVWDRGLTPTPFKVLSCGIQSLAIVAVPVRNRQGGKEAFMDEILQRFIERAPVAVMVQATAARAIADSARSIDIYERHADSQYTRDLTFAAVSRLLTQVVFRSYPSVNAAYRHNEEISVSVTSVYNKLNGLETAVSQARWLPRRLAR